MDKKTIAVCGATGQQGGATVEALMKKGQWSIVALSRDPESTKSKALKEKGIQVVKADLLDKESLATAFRNAQMVFGVTQPFSSDYKKTNTEQEVEQGRNIVDACLKAGVEFLVHSTVFSSGMKDFGVAHLDSKTTIADYVKKSGLPYTILKPASFMDNIGTDFFTVKKGRIRGLTDKDVKVPYIAAKDIGEFAALVFEQPLLYYKKELDLVADFMSGEDLASIMGKIRNGEHFKYTAVPKLAMRLFAKEFYGMRVSFEKAGRPPYPKEVETAIQNCREMHPGIMTVEKYFLYRKYDSKEL
ncbi:MAG: NmrA/HSCARG family protein [Chitinivibrionales bacterium]